jgi:hypothetical protein
MTLTDTILSNAVLLAGLTALVRAALAWQRGLTWPEYRLAHGGKRLLAPRLDGRLPGVSLVNPKGYHDDAEYLRTIDAPAAVVVRHLRRGGGSLHLINSLKRRPTPAGGHQYSVAHLVWTHDNGRQTEAYLFPAAEGRGVDVYAHSETSVADPAGHLQRTKQVDGDPRGVVGAALNVEEFHRRRAGG